MHPFDASRSRTVQVSVWSRLAVLFALLVSITSGCDSQPAAKLDQHQDVIQQIIETEKTILSLAPYVSKIADSLTDLGPESNASIREFFAENIVHIRDEGSKTETAEQFLEQLWQPFLGSRKFVECQFGTLAGTFENSRQRFDMKMKFEGKIQDGQNIIGVKATQTITWEKINKLWTITQWTQHSFETSQPQASLFVDSTTKFIPDPNLFEAVSTSSHQQRILEAIDRKRVLNPMIDGLPGFNDVESAWQFPSVSIVDYDNDGWDDIFLTDRWTSGMLLRNDAGTFVDATNDAGLKVGPNTNCTIFADFDNDGDSDAFIGCSISGSQYFTNVDGTFQLDSETTQQLKDVRLITAGSVADFNRDGLLDLYLSTYVLPSGSADSDWPDRMIRESDRDRLTEAMAQHPFVNRGGPANVLLINVDGKLRRCETDETLEQWRNSYQSVWHDWDSDGDQDLFVCNDFAPDALLRNDTPTGSQKPIFKDVTKELIGPDIMGYSMGGSWGDFDNDGDMDLFVTEMYSKAGNRILKQFAAADKRSVTSAKGNFLFRNDGGKFTEVAAEKNASKTGWAFGGQFADVNNDGWLDLYVPSGFYTAPAMVRGDADL